MSLPKVLARSPDDPTFEDTRAETVAGPSMTVSYSSGAVGTVRVETFLSDDDEDRGGIVLRIEIEDHASSWIPAARQTPKGVELHVAGDAEGASFVRALRGVLAALPEPSRYRGPRY